MNHNITPALFDSVLDHLVAHIPYGLMVEFNLYQNPIPLPEDISYYALDRLLKEMRNDGLLALGEGGCDDNSYIFLIGINRAAITLKNRGGYKGQELLLRQNIEKLLLEIEHLRPSNPKQIETITTIAANITTALGFVVGAVIK